MTGYGRARNSEIRAENLEATLAIKRANAELKGATAEFLRTLKAVAIDTTMDLKHQAKMDTAKLAYCPYCGAGEEPDGHGKAHADDCPIVTGHPFGPPKNNDEGETPS